MSLFYWVDNPTDPASTFRGAWAPGEEVLVAGESQVVPSAAEGNWFPRVEDVEPPGLNIATETWEIGNARVFVTFTPDPSAAQQAADAKKIEILKRHIRAFELGVPVTFNGKSAQLRATADDFQRYGLVDRDHVPPEGVLAVSLTPIVGIPNNRTSAMIKGAALVGQVLDAFTVFKSQADDAALRCSEAVDDLLDGGATAATIAAYDVETIGGTVPPDPGWPSNT